MARYRRRFNVRNQRSSTWFLGCLEFTSILVVLIFISQITLNCNYGILAEARSGVSSSSSSSLGAPRLTEIDNIASATTSRPRRMQRTRTRLTGYGSQAAHKSIFHSRYRKLHGGKHWLNPSGTTTNATTLWVQRVVKRDKQTRRKLSPQLWFRYYDPYSSSIGSSSSNTSALCFSITSLHQNLDNYDETTDSSANWQVQTCADHELPSSHWVPLEGVYGVYLLPSGLLWVLITETEDVYEVPTNVLSSNSNNNNNNNNNSATVFHIRRVQSMELFHQTVATSTHHPFLTPSYPKQQQQEKEQARQVNLLRHALKEHDFYYVPRSTSRQSSKTIPIPPDMTRTLQQSLDMYQLLQQKMNNKETDASNLVVQWPTKKWWKKKENIDKATDDYYPDSSFFWNEMAVNPLLQAYQHLLETGNGNGTINSTNWSSSSTCFHTLLDHVIPVTSAFVGVQRNLSVSTVDITSDWRYDELLISRRSRFRAGTRFTRRGADALGHVANYAETEQVLVVYRSNDDQEPTANDAANVELYSHVQVRGSIPLRWSSPSDVTSYRPRVRIGTDPLAQARAVWSHVVEQFQRYSTPHQNATTMTTTVTVPQLVFCNLIDKKSDQGRLGRAFDAVLQAVLDVYQDFNAHWNETGRDEQIDLKWNTTNISISPLASSPTNVFVPKHVPFLTSQAVKHIWYDFHAQVKGGKYDKLSALLQQLSPTLNKQGFLGAHFDGRQWTVSQRQSGIVRTNCIDCLDRTNVVQSIIGRHMLFQQLSTRRGSSTHAITSKARSLQHRRSFPTAYKVVFRRDSMQLPWEAGEKAHRLLWADNADVISRLYAGTPALKGDFTRTGKRTKRGALDDGVNSLQRFYLNNFLDADRQEGIDLMVGQGQFTTSRDLLEEESQDQNVSHSNQMKTLKEAVRAMMLGRTEVDESASDERFHIRIKQPQIKLQGDRSEPTTERKRRAILELRWLPGDLQNQMRSLAATLQESSLPPYNGFSVSASARLSAMDRRLATEVPWWVVADSDTEEESDPVAPPTIDGVFTTNSGHLIGAVVAAFQAPLTTATVTVTLLGLLLEQRSKTKKNEDVFPGKPSV